MSDNTNNKSLYMYTALIFIVAVVLIIVSFFGQARLDKTQPIPVSQEEVNSITQRAAVLSHENQELINTNLELKKQLEEATGNLVTAQTELEALKKSKDNTALLTSAHLNMLDEKYEEAKAALEQVDAAILTEDEITIYNKVKNAVGGDEN